MVRTPEQVSKDIISHLNTIDPEMSAQIGSPERKIIDAVSSVISASYIQSQITASMWDIDAKSGIELEEVCALFGFGRREGSFANGTLVIQLQQPAPTDYVIPAGTIASTTETEIRPSVKYETTSPVVITTGTSYAEVPARCTEVGAIGNTASQTIVTLESWSSVGSVYNPGPFTNGTNAETDEELRERFRNTFLRNLSGTEEFYAALCLNHKNVTKVRVLGPVERHQEQLQVVRDGTDRLILQSGIDHSKFAWPKSTIVTKNNGTSENTWYREGVTYSVNTENPQIRLLIEDVDEASDPDGYYMHEGDIVNVEHEYVSVASRNDPKNGITNKVDIFVNGSEPTNVIENAVINLRALNSTYLNGKSFVDDYGNKVTSGLMQVLGYGPIISLPNTLEIGGTTYKNQTPDSDGDFRLVREDSVYSGSTKAVYGLLFTGTNYPANGSKLDITYSYNKVPMTLDALLLENKQITTDVLVHEADIVPIGVSIIIQLEKGYTEESVRAEIRQNITSWMSGLGYGEWIQMSDIHNVVRKSPGVDNARIKTEADGGVHGVRIFSRNGRFVIDTKTSDFRLADNQIPAFNSLELLIRAENTFGVK